MRTPDDLVISIPAPREGGARGAGAPRGGGPPASWLYFKQNIKFHSTPPAWGATSRMPRRTAAYWHFNPRPPRGGRPGVGVVQRGNLAISIHAPREGGDGLGGIKATVDDISIHAPREGGDGDAIAHQLHRMISIHAPREGGDTLVRSRIAGRDISIHAPREGGDCRPWGAI